jgi:hypothetical protein
MKRLALILTGLLAPTTAFAVQITQYWDCTGHLRCGSSLNAVTDLATRIVLVVGYFIGGLAVCAFLYGAIMMIISQGDEKKEAGKKAMIWAGVGLALALMVALIRTFIEWFIVTIAA